MFVTLSVMFIVFMSYESQLMKLEIVKWIEFVNPSVNSIQKKKKKSVNWALKCLANVAREETMIEHEAR